jgi:hypothetical protein
MSRRVGKSEGPQPAAEHPRGGFDDLSGTPIGQPGELA